MASRPVIGVHEIVRKPNSGARVALPGVFLAPIRPDVVGFVHSHMNKNHRQAYAVAPKAGHNPAAESWGTGRAVSRIPRVHGSGTSRAGQGAFGNMCRGGRMFNPTKIYRRWHRKINVTQRRYALASAIAASGIPALVMARGHRVAHISEVPLVVSNDLESVQKTQKAIAALKVLGAYADVEKVKNSKTLRSGKGKARNRRWTQRRGPLVIYNKDKGIVRAVRNLPGVDTCCVTRLNLLQLAPGGHLGRFCIWTEDAFRKLHALYGSTNKASSLKTDYHLPRSKMGLADLHRILSSDEIKAAVRPKRKTLLVKRKVNPLRNLQAKTKLNPFAMTLVRRRLLAAKAEKKTAPAAATPRKSSKLTKEQKVVRNKNKHFVQKKKKEHFKKLFA